SRAGVDDRAKGVVDAEWAAATRRTEAGTTRRGTGRREAGVRATGLADGMADPGVADPGVVAPHHWGEQPEQARLAGALLDLTLTAHIGADLRIQQLQLVGREPVTAQGRGRVGGESGGEPGIGQQSLEYGIEVTHDRLPPQGPRQSSSGMGTGCGRGR